MIDRRFLHEHLAHDLNRILDRKLVFLGCGAIGANLAISLARRGFKKFWLVDRDRIELHNISTQPWSKMSMIGSLKTHALATILCNISEVEALSIYKNVEAPAQLLKFFPHDADLVIDSFDNSKARQIAQDIGRDYPVLHIGMSGEGTAEVRWAENYTVPKDVELPDPCQYPLSRTLVELTVVAGAETIMEFLLTGNRRGYFIDSKFLKVMEI